MIRHVHHHAFNFWGLNREQLALGLATLGMVACIGLMHFPWIPFFQWLFSLLPRGFKRGIRVGRIRVPDTARLRHTHIVGATGTGKTVLLEQLLFQDIKRGYGAIVIDPKGERSFYDSVKDYCRSIGREQDLVFLSATHPKESAVWNPCALGDASELQTKFFNSAIYSEPHYAKACEFALGTAFTRLRSTHVGPITLEHLRAQLKRLAKGEDKETFQGLFFDLHNLMASDWSAVLGVTPDPSRPTVSLLDIITKNKILFVDLPTEGKKVQSSRIGRLLTQEIILISGMRKRSAAYLGDRPFSIYIDEFDAFATESFSSFLNKGRSSDFMIHLAHQTLSDLNEISPDFAGKIMGNCNVRFIFRQDDPDDAERWSRFLGTRKVIKSTYKTQDGSRTGDVSNRETMEFNVPPDTIKSLKIGRCVFSMKTEDVCQILKVPFKRRKRRKPPICIEATAENSTPPLPLAPESPAPLTLNNSVSYRGKRWTRLKSKNLTFSPSP